MKKTFILLALFMGLSQLAWSQHKIRPTAGLHQQLSMQRLGFRLSTSPMVGIQSLRHSLSVGPVIQLRNFPSAEEKSFSSKGFQTSYQFITTGNRNNLFLFFVDISSKFQVFNEEWVSNSWNKELQKYQDHETGSQENLWENYIGFGVSNQLLDKLQLQAKLSVGYFFSEIKPVRGATSNIPLPHDYRFYGDKGAAFSFGVGAVYQF